MEDKTYKILTGKADEQECLSYYKYLQTNPGERDDFIQLKNLLTIQIAKTQIRLTAEKEKQVAAFGNKIENKPEPIRWKGYWHMPSIRATINLSCATLKDIWDKSWKLAYPV